MIARHCFGMFGLILTLLLVLKSLQMLCLKVSNSSSCSDPAVEDSGSISKSPFSPSFILELGWGSFLPFDFWDFLGCFENSLLGLVGLFSIKYSWNSTRSFINPTQSPTPPFSQFLEFSNSETYEVLSFLFWEDFGDEFLFFNLSLFFPFLSLFLSLFSILTFSIIAQSRSISSILYNFSLSFSFGTDSLLFLFFLFFFFFLLVLPWPPFFCTSPCS